MRLALYGYVRRDLSPDGRLRARAEMTALDSPSAASFECGLPQIMKCPACAETRAEAAVCTVATCVVDTEPAESKAMLASGTRKVVPTTRRSPRVPPVSHWTLIPAPTANTAVEVPVVTPPPVSVQIPASVPLVSLTESPVFGTVMFTSSGKPPLIASKNVLRLAGKPVAVESK